MHKQKTVAKWLAIVLLCTIAVGSYLIYDAFYADKNIGTEIAANASSDKDKVDDNPEQNTPPEPPKEPYYTTLPREGEIIGGVSVAHTGGESTDTYHKSVAFGKKVFAFFTTQSREYDMKKNGLSLAIFEDESLISTLNVSDTENFGDCKFTPNGILLTTSADNGRAYLFSEEGRLSADVDIPSFDNGKFYLDGSTPLWFYTSNGVLRCGSFVDGLLFQRSSFLFETGDCELKIVFKKDNIAYIITENENGICGYSFEQYKGFKLLFSLDNLAFRQFLPTSDGYSVIVGSDGINPVVVSFDQSMSPVAYRTLVECTDGAAYTSKDGFTFVGNGTTYGLCKHLDITSSSKNGMTFSEVRAFSPYKDGFCLLALNEKGYTVHSQNTDIFIAENVECPSLIQTSSGVRLTFSSDSHSGLCRANFGDTDVFTLVFPSL